MAAGATASPRAMGKAHGVPLPAPLAALRAASPSSARRLLLCLLAGCLAAPAALLLARRAGPGARGAPGGSPSFHSRRDSAPLAAGPEGLEGLEGHGLGGAHGRGPGGVR